MRRVVGILSSAAAVASLVLLVALWARSYFASECFKYNPRRFDTWAVGRFTNPGQFQVWYDGHVQSSFEDSGLTAWRHPPRWAGQSSVLTVVGGDRLGFGYRADRAAREWDVWVPIPLLLVVPLAFLLWRAWRHRRRARGGGFEVVPPAKGEA